MIHLRRFENENGIPLLDSVGGHFSLSSLEASISQVLKAEPSTVIRGCLLGVANPPLNVVKVQKLALLWLGALSMAVSNTYFTNIYLGN